MGAWAQWMSYRTFPQNKEYILSFYWHPIRRIHRSHGFCTLRRNRTWKHWNGNAVILTTFWSLAAPKVVVQSVTKNIVKRTIINSISVHPPWYFYVMYVIYAVETAPWPPQFMHYRPGASDVAYGLMKRPCIWIDHLRNANNQPQAIHSHRRKSPTTGGWKITSQ